MCFIPALPLNIRLGRKGSTEAKRSSLFFKKTSDKVRSLRNTDTCIIKKTFFFFFTGEGAE